MFVSLLRQSIPTVGSLLLLGAFCGNTAKAIPPLDPTDARWTSRDGQVWLHDHPFHIKGVNWFGLETPTAKLLGLQKRSLSDLLDALRDQGFNALRIPVSVQWVHALDHIPKDQTYQRADADLRGKPWISMLDKLVQEAGRRGIVILLDMHTISAGDNLTTKRWYNQNYDVCAFREAWHILLDRYGHHWNILGLDLKNELHDVTWGTAEFDGETPTDCRAGTGPEAPTDWRLELETLIPELHKDREDPKGRTYRFGGLYVVQGMHHGRIGNRSYPYGFEHAYDYWYGGNLEGLKNYPLRLKANLGPQIAYTIHTYGPAVYPQYYFDTLDAYEDPSRLAPVFEQQSGFIEELTGRAVLIGEWGGVNEIIDLPQNPLKHKKDDGVILGAIAQWYRKNCIGDGFWWAVNPESSDTGGLFTDSSYKKWVQHRLDRASELQPNPTRLGWNKQGQLIWETPGSLDPECRQALETSSP